MTRTVTSGVLITDNFAVLAGDDFTKLTGMVPDMVVTVRRNGVVVAPFTVNITETAGEYTMTFTPNQTGYWEIEVAVASASRRLSFEYDAQASTAGGALPGQTFYDRVVDPRGNGIPNVLVRVYEADTANLLYTTETNILGDYTVPLVGNLALDILVDITYSGGGIQTFTKQDMRLV